MRRIGVVLCLSACRDIFGLADPILVDAAARDAQGDATVDAAPQPGACAEFPFAYGTHRYRQTRSIVLTWQSAADTCALFGGYLFVPDTAAELDAVSLYLGPNNFRFAGVFRGVNQWKTVLGTALMVTFPVWDAGEPGANDNIAVVNPNTHLLHGAVTSEAGGICECATGPGTM